MEDLKEIDMKTILLIEPPYQEQISPNWFDETSHLS